MNVTRYDSPMLNFNTLMIIMFQKLQVFHEQVLLVGIMNFSKKCPSIHICEENIEIKMA